MRLILCALAVLMFAGCTEITTSSDGPCDYSNFNQDCTECHQAGVE